MSTSETQHLSAALSRDLRSPNSKTRIKISDEPARKTFTANKDGAVWVFPYKQPDPAYWTGMKHYASGTSSRIRMPRTQTAPAPATAE